MSDRDILCVTAECGEVGLTLPRSKLAATWNGASARSRRKIRVVASVSFHYGAVYARCIGTHRAYDAIDPQAV
jgi:hypothetical protein